MIEPQIPENEEQRIVALKKLAILDTLPEKEFDNITKLASGICNTPMALVSFVDENRQVFKSSKGLKMNCTSRTVSFCAHAINNPEKMLIIEDARKDPRFQRNPLVTSLPKVVFYAGVPLVSSEGYALGTLCVLDDKPRQLTPQQREALMALSEQVMKLLELKQRTIELEGNESELQIRNEQLQQFTHSISHDLRAPLNSIEGLLQVLLINNELKPDGKAREYVKLLLSVTTRSRTVIDDLLHYIGLESDYRDETLADFNKIVNDVKENLISLIIETNSKIIIENTLPKIMVQRSTIERLFQNLISNAIKFRKRGVEPEIKISSSEIPTHYVFQVSDNGLGIPEDYINILFKPFKRLHRAEKQDGIGLGLAICKKITEMHGGEISVTSEVGKGSVFTFSLLKA